MNEVIYTSIASHTYFFVCENTDSTLSEFQLYGKVLSTIVTMLKIKHSDIIHVITESFNYFISLS